MFSLCPDVCPAVPLFHANIDIFFTSHEYQTDFNEIWWIATPTDELTSFWVKIYHGQNDPTKFELMSNQCCHIATWLESPLHTCSGGGIISG